jgi:hypothetical protein
MSYGTTDKAKAAIKRVASKTWVARQAHIDERQLAKQPTSSWWLDKSRSELQATAQREQPRMSAQSTHRARNEYSEWGG